MGLRNFFKEHTKKAWILTISLFLLIVILFFTVAYVSGKNVSEKVQMQWVSHTEYWNNDSASTIVRLADYKGLPIEADSCNVKIVYPDKSVFVNNGAMAESSIAGNWYRTDSLIGKPLGTYEQEVTCVRGGQTIKSSQSFHLNPALEEVNAISNKANLLNESLFNFDIQLSGDIANTNQTLNTRISVAETNLNNALNSAHQDILNNLSATGTNLNNNLNNVNATIITRIDAFDSEITSNLNSVNISLTNFLEYIRLELSLQLTEMLNNLTSQLTDIKSDTSWIVSNAMNQDNAAEINNRFSSLDSDLDKVLAFCSEGVTNSSALCVEVYNLREAVEILRQEQEIQFNQLNETTTNTWEFLSGSISDRIDNILVQLNIIQEQNREINSTTHQILDEVQGEIRVSIIS
jgi:hypothetical protein